MSTLPRRQNGIYITMAIAIIGAVAAGIVLYTSSQATEVELTSAELVPDDAGVYFALNTDLSSDQWVAAFDLSRRLGGPEDARTALEDGAEEEDLGWDDDVAPFLGGNASVYIKGFDPATLDVQGAAILKAADAGRALEVVLEQLGEYEEDSYNGVTTYRQELEGTTATYLARIDDHLVFAIDEPSLREVIDVSNGDLPALSSDSDFRRLRDELTGNFLGFVYLDWGSLAGDLAVDDEEVRQALEEAGLGELAFEPVAAVIGAKGDAFSFQEASVGEPGPISPMTEPRVSRFAAMVPADTAMFVSTVGLAQTWQQVIDAAGDEIDEAIRSEGEYASLDDALRDAGSELGLESIEELIELFTGETALAAWYASADEEDQLLAVLAEVSDETAAREVIDSIAAPGDTELHDETIAGVEARVFVDDEGDRLAFLVHDGYIAIGHVEALQAILAPAGATLAQADRYREAVGLMPSALGTYGYFDMAVLLRLASDGVPVELDQAERMIEALILNMVEEDGVVRLSGALTVADDE